MRCHNQTGPTAMLRLYGLSLLSLAAGLVASALAVPISVHDRGPCPNAADGVCIPNRKTFGFYTTKWRPWPGQRPRAAAEATRPGLGKPPHETQPYELPPVEEEDTFGQPGGAPLPGGPPPATGQPPTGDGAARGDLPPKPPLDSEDAPPVPPPGLRDAGPVAPPQGLPPPTTPKTEPPLGAYNPGRQPVQPTSGQRTGGLIWRQRTTHAPVAKNSQRLVPISTGQQQRSSNPLRASRRPAAEMVTSEPSRPTYAARKVTREPSRPTQAARQVAYTVARPHPPQPARSQSRLRPNPLRQQQ
jgi:hypothetical protein